MKFFSGIILGVFSVLVLARGATADYQHQEEESTTIIGASTTGSTTTAIRGGMTTNRNGDDVTPAARKGGAGVLLVPPPSSPSAGTDPRPRHLRKNNKTTKKRGAENGAGRDDEDEEQEEATGVSSSSSICDNEVSRLMLAIRCRDGTERLVCAPNTRNNACMDPNTGWAESKCNQHGGFDKVLPYYSGCYPKSKSFWEDYAPSLDFSGMIAPGGGGGGAGNDEENNEEESTSSTTSICDIDDLTVPPLNLPNLNFEDRAIGINEWDKTEIGGDFMVRHKCDDPSRCVARPERCMAYEGTCYALINAGDTRYEYTPVQSLSRNDFRIPEVDTSGVCNNYSSAGSSTSTTNFCFSFAMRFVAKDYASEGKNDRFTVKVQINKGGPVLYERLIQISDVGDHGDSGWEVVQVPLPTVPIGDATYFEFQATTANVGDHALDSIGYIDDLKIMEC